jgi:hypothetical protein
MSFTRFAANITAVGHTVAHTVPFSNNYLLQINQVGSVSTQVTVELTSDGVQWWTPTSLNPISSGTDVLVYQLTYMPALQMRLNVTAIDPGVTIDGYVGNL